MVLTRSACKKHVKWNDNIEYIEYEIDDENKLTPYQYEQETSVSLSDEDIERILYYKLKPKLYVQKFIPIYKWPPLKFKKV